MAVITPHTQDEGMKEVCKLRVYCTHFPLHQVPVWLILSVVLLQEVWYICSNMILASRILFSEILAILLPFLSLELHLKNKKCTKYDQSTIIECRSVEFKLLRRETSVDDDSGVTEIIVNKRTVVLYLFSRKNPKQLFSTIFRDCMEAPG